MEADFSATNISQLRMKVGEIKKMESLKKSVMPPFLMVIPFIDLPDCLTLDQQVNMDEEGVQGCIFTIRATKPGQGEITTGFRDLREGKDVLKKSIMLKVEP